MPEIAYVGKIEPSAQIEKEAYAHIGLLRIPELRGNELKIAISKASDMHIYYARVTGPEEKFAGELYFPMSAHESYARVLKEGLSQIGSRFMPILRRQVSIKDDKRGFEMGDFLMEATTVCELWKAVQACTPADIGTLRTSLLFRLRGHEHMPGVVEALVPEPLQEAAKKELVLDGCTKKIISEALVNAENFEFYITGEKPKSQ